MTILIFIALLLFNSLKCSEAKRSISQSSSQMSLHTARPSRSESSSSDEDEPASGLTSMDQTPKTVAGSAPSTTTFTARLISAERFELPLSVLAIKHSDDDEWERIPTPQENLEIMMHAEVPMLAEFCITNRYQYSDLSKIAIYQLAINYVRKFNHHEKRLQEEMKVFYKHHNQGTLPAVPVISRTTAQTISATSSSAAAASICSAAKEVSATFEWAISKISGR